MKYILKAHHRNITDQELIDDVIAVSKKLSKNTVTICDHLEHGIYHPYTIRTRFNSWFTVLQRAGLKASRPPINIDEKLLFENLEDVWKRLGKQPEAEKMKDPLTQSQFSHSTYIRRFGTWTNALRKFIEYQNAKRPGSGEIKHRLKIVRRSGGKNKRVKANPRYISPTLRFSVFLRDGFRCTACGRSPLTEPGVKLHCDHIEPWSKGGKTVVRNLRTLCSLCNIGKGSKQCQWLMGGEK